MTDRSDLTWPGAAAIGRPRKDPPADAAARIVRMAARTFSMDEMALAFGIDRKTFAVWRKEYPELEAACQAGQAIERRALHRALRRQGMNGYAPALMFLLKARHGYREGEPVEGDRGPIVQIVMPGAAKPVEWVDQVAPPTERLR